MTNELKKLLCVARELRLRIHWPMIHCVNGSIVASYTAKGKFPFLLHSVSLYNLFENETLFTFQMFVMSSFFYSCDYILSD